MPRTIAVFGAFAVEFEKMTPIPAILIEELVKRDDWHFFDGVDRRLAAASR